MRVAIKFAYDGTCFHGYQRQPDVRTVEGDLMKALISLGAMDSAEDSLLRSSSRTDSGVSAIGNVLALNTEFRLEELPRALNSKVRDIWVWGYAEVSGDFNPRHAVQRWYRYYFPPNVSPQGLKKASRLFIGQHDFTLFAYREEKSPVRRIDKIEVNENRGFTTLDIWGKSFLRGMVRKIAWATEHVALGKLTLTDVERALQGKDGDFGIAHAEPTVLMDVEYGFDFVVQDRVGEFSLQLDERVWKAHLSLEVLTLILNHSRGHGIRKAERDWCMPATNTESA